LSCKPLKVAAGGSSLSETTWGRIDVQAGAQVGMPLADAFWGARYGRLIDPVGHSWSLATQKEDLTPKEISKRAEAAFGDCASST
jgi:hypothetical protein